nr:nuclear transport factor 2 family protein [Actinomycetota bacterium]
MALLKRKRIGLNDAMEVVTRFVNACNRHDADGVGACLHPDFDSIQPMYPSRNFRGADQVRRNWQAIFDAEPGFRLTVLRSASADDTVWLELHGAGRDAEVAGIFIMGIVGDRIRWARIYSALVEPVAAGVGEASDPAAGLTEVDSHATAGGEDVIAPVLDMERSGR